MEVIVKIDEFDEGRILEDKDCEYCKFAGKKTYEEPCVDCDEGNKFDLLWPELIRCRECKFWGGHMHFGYKNVNECVMHHFLTPPDFYCGAAKRKEESNV